MSFEFLCVNDLHYIDLQGESFFGRMVDRMKTAAPQARFLLVLGDLCEDGSLVQLTPMKRILDSIGLPVRVLCGNHDWLTDTDRSAFESLWPGSINYTFEEDEWQFVVVDSTCGKPYENTQIPQSTLDWLNERLPQLDRTRPMVLATHFPLGEGVKFRPMNAGELLERFAGHNLRHVLSGHYHASTERRVGKVVLSTSVCCAFARENHGDSKDSPKGFLVCRAEGESIQQRVVAVD